jgi:hypothetical protein
LVAFFIKRAVTIFIDFAEIVIDLDVVTVYFTGWTADLSPQMHFELLGRTSSDFSVLEATRRLVWGNFEYLKLIEVAFS